MSLNLECSALLPTSDWFAVAGSWLLYHLAREARTPSDTGNFGVMGLHIMGWVKFRKLNSIWRLQTIVEKCNMYDHPFLPGTVPAQQCPCLLRACHIPHIPHFKIWLEKLKEASVKSSVNRQ